MDSRNCLGNESLDAIRQKISSGELTLEEMNRRLKRAINTEIMKPPAEMDIAFLRSCQDLQYAINNSTEYVSKAPQYAKELREHTKKHTSGFSIPKRLIAATGIAASLLVLLIIGDGILHREWFTGRSTPDQEQYNVTGHVIDPGLVESGNANGPITASEIETSNFAEVVDMLGFAPITPSWLPDGWSIESYFALVEEGYLWFSADYAFPNSVEKLKYEMRQYADMETANDSFEQNEHGLPDDVNGWKVYITENIERSVAVWYDGDTVYTVHGPVGKSDLLDMINSIEKRT